MKGSTFKQCAHGTTGTRNKRACPKKHGTWGYVFGMQVDGRRKQVRRTGWPNEDAAQAALNEALAAAQRGEWVDDGRGDPTMAVFLAEHLETVRHGLRYSTFVSYNLHLTNYLVPLLGRIKLTELRAAHISRMVTALIDGDERAGRKPVSIATARRAFSTLRAALNAAVKQRRINYNPCAGVRLPAEPKSSSATWSAEQVGTFLRAAQGEPLAVLYRLLLLRGLRRGEACGLRWADLDLSAGTLRVAQAVVQVGKAVSIGAPKTKGSARVISLDPATVAAFKAHRRTQAAERLAAVGAYDDHDLVFAEQTGEPIRPDHVSDRFQQIARAAGLPVIRLHDARHTAASLALKTGASMKEIQELLGHSTYKLTADTYSHIVAETRDATAARVAAAIEGA